jgi:hypothetical protein
MLFGLGFLNTSICVINIIMFIIIKSIYFKNSIINIIIFIINKVLMLKKLLFVL